jgi:hypothetical protein
MSNPTVFVRWLKPDEIVTVRFVVPGTGEISFTESLQMVVKRTSDMLERVGLDLAVAIDVEDGYVLEPWTVILACCEPLHSAKVTLIPHERKTDIQTTIAWAGDCVAVEAS